MKATRPFIPPTALRYIEQLEESERQHHAELAVAVGRLRDARAAIAELLLHEEGITDTDLRDVASMLVAPPVPPTIGEPWWRKPENADIEVEHSANPWTDPKPWVDPVSGQRMVFRPNINPGHYMKQPRTRAQYDAEEGNR